MMKAKVTVALGFGVILGLIVVASACFAGKWDWQTGSGASSSSSSVVAAPSPSAATSPPSSPPPPATSASTIPRITQPIMFNQPAADEILSRMQIFPKDNPWNWDISKTPLLKNSAQMIATMGAGGALACNLDMGFIIAPPNQPRVPVRITAYPEDSEKGPFPVPIMMPIEEWPIAGGNLAAYQQKGGGGDRHSIVVDPINGMLYEFYQTRRTNAGWEAGCAAVFNLKTNAMRPKGWTSTDAAGLPLFPAVVRYDECARGMVNHAMRVTMKRTRDSYVYPARHYASKQTDPNLPRMGERLRLRRDFNIAGFSPHVQAILKGLMKYGMFVADNGGNWRISVAPDLRIVGLDELKRVKGSDFEVVDTSGMGGE